MLSPDPSLTKPPTLQRVKGMPASSASLVRNRHLASLASGIAAFHRNEETEATVSALLWELSDENAKILTGVERACATAMDAASSYVLCATSSLAGSPKVVPPAQALSEVWMSRADTSVHWVLTRLRRLEALVQSSDAHLSFVEQEEDLKIENETTKPMLCSFVPETSKTLLENDLEVSLEIENPSVDSMVEALVQKFGNH